MGKKRIPQKLIALFVAALLLLSTPLMYAAGRNSPSGWAEKEVERAITRGLVPDSLQIRYTEPMTREGFCALAVRVYEIAAGRIITLRKAFSDTNDVNVQKMGGLGVISGKGNNIFAPNDLLSRQEAATIMSRLMEELNVPLVTRSPRFLDNADIADWARSSVGQMQAAGIMSGTGNNRFSPRSVYSTEQGIVTLLKVYDLAIQIKFEEIVSADVPLSGFFDLDDSSELKQHKAELIKLVNAEREKAGLTRLIEMELLHAAATVRAAECELKYSHTRPDGRDFVTVLDDLDLRVRGIGETLDRNPESAEEVVRRWMNSQVHRECILVPNWEKMGVGVHRGSNGTLYWAMVLIV